MEAKTVIRAGVVVALIGVAGVLLEKMVWQAADTYPALLAGHRSVNHPQKVGSFSAGDARTVCSLNDTDDVYDNADVAFKKNGTFVRCRNHIISRVYHIQYGNPADDIK
ncbi:TPA: hypothetical protein JLF94_002906 [Escherichia coli]|nr:hypothetical protein [Escherichia coli]HAV9341877.1 hypothetical protein [Escherichia coli]HDT3329541.1 hypothetical protein [Escherichia coli]